MIMHYNPYIIHLFVCQPSSIFSKVLECERPWICVPGGNDPGLVWGLWDAAQVNVHSQMDSQFSLLSHEGATCHLSPQPKRTQSRKLARATAFPRGTRKAGKTSWKAELLMERAHSEFITTFPSGKPEVFIHRGNHETTSCWYSMDLD